MLKEEIIRLKKLLSKSDKENPTQTTESIDKKENNRNQTDQLKAEWRCTGTPGCEGHLEIVLFNKIDQEYYFRKCTKCFHRTRGQKYTNSVKGIIKKT